MGLIFGWTDAFSKVHSQSRIKTQNKGFPVDWSDIWQII